MMKLWPCVVVGALLLAGCGASPATPIAAQAPAAQAQANRLLDKIEPYAFWHEKDGRAYVHFDITSLTGKKSKETDVTYSTDGKFGTISKLMIAADGGLYVRKATKEPRVYTFHRVGATSIKGLESGEKLSLKLAAGGKFKSKRGLPIPMLDYSYVVLLLDQLPAAEKAEPRWATL